MKKGELIKLINADFPDMKPITKNTKKDVINNSSSYRGSVRLSTGRFFTDSEYQNKKKKVLNTPLP